MRLVPAAFASAIKICLRMNSRSDLLKLAILDCPRSVWVKARDEKILPRQVKCWLAQFVGHVFLRELALPGTRDTRLEFA
ncbi:hypothetical protein D9M71_389120 [compost metagenome]